MKSILFITTVFRTGEKVYPILPGLCERYDVDALHLFQMSNKTGYNAEQDVRQDFYGMCEKHCRNVFHGPSYLEDKSLNAKNNKEFIKDFPSILDDHYDIVFIDNNTTIKGGCNSFIYEYFSSRGSKVIGSPHGNKEFKRYRISKKISSQFDYSFVFGKKDKSKFINLYPNNSYLSERLIPGGIPSNDILKNYKRGNKYILIVPSITDPRYIQKQTKYMKCFTKTEFDALRILDISKEYQCPVIIKEKNKLYYQTSYFQNQLKNYSNVIFQKDVKDMNQLVADAITVIGAPSTLSFKSIQMGIPTIMLKGYGEVGNFYDYPGLIDVNYKLLLKTIQQQIDTGKHVSFIENTLSGGLNFTSVDIYLKYIDKLVEDKDYVKH